MPPATRGLPSACRRTSSTPRSRRCTMPSSTSCSGPAPKRPSARADGWCRFAATAAETPALDGRTRQMNDASTLTAASAIPFDAAKLDAILDRAGIDALIVSSKHNIQYLLGGYRFFFFEHFDAIGIGRYTPLLVYQ